MDYIMNKKERFNKAYKYLEYIGIVKKQEDIAEKMKASRSNVSSALSGNEKVLTERFIMRFAKAFDIFSLEWLLTGDGNMLKNDSSQRATPSSIDVAPKLDYHKIIKDVVPAKPIGLILYTTTKAGLEFYQKDDGSLVMRAPIVPQSVLGSMPSEWEEGANLYDDYEWEYFPVDAVHHGRYYAFRISGDSMDDGTRRSFESGDIVLVHELPKDKWAPSLHIRTWPFWVVVFGNNVRMKEIVAQDEKTGAITLHSLNPSPEYTDFQLGLDEIDRLFNVVQHIPHPRKF